MGLRASRGGFGPRGSSPWSPSRLWRRACRQAPPLRRRGQL